MRWRLFLGVIAFAVWAPPSLVGLPCAALLAVAPDRSLRARVAAAAIGAVSVGLLVVPGGGRLGAAISAYIVLVTAAFVTGALLAPAGFIRQALRAILTASAATVLLVQVVWGPSGWGALAWEATRQAGLAMRFVVELQPDAFPLYEPAVRFLSVTTPGMLALQTLAGLALAWQCHVHLAALPLGASLAPFREFRFGDGWVWGVVAWLGLVIAPVSGALHMAGTNLGLVLGALYLLRGAAIVVVVAQALGVSAAALVIAGAVAAVLAVPLVLLIPGLCTLGITDTWYEYRRRLAARRSNTT
ncbi:MAG TPA: DUF2232 domain-containing protein [Gemmatimonadales bacterium]|jgi:hypothetical protein|nr:DUF2232 domain-containing protein [Gemmatimonadales bacterium]